jgi:Fe-S cluster assembly scaffold protein SufB
VTFSWRSHLYVSEKSRFDSIWSACTTFTCHSMHHATFNVSQNGTNHSFISPLSALYWATIDLVGTQNLAQDVDNSSTSRAKDTRNATMTQYRGSISRPATRHLCCDHARENQAGAFDLATRERCTREPSAVHLADAKLRFASMLRTVTRRL